MTSSGVTLKIELDGEVRRLRGWPKDGAEPTVPSLRDSICGLFGISDANLSDVKYRDEEGDLCTLIGATLPDALEMAKTQSNVLRLICSVEPVPAIAPSGISSSLPAVTIETECKIGEETTGRASPASSQAHTVQATRDDDPGRGDEEPHHGSDQVPPASSSPSTRDVDEFLNDTIHLGEQIPEQITNLQCKIAERIHRAQPQLIEGVSNFKQQIVDDFHTTRDDMKSAFVARPSSCCSESQQPATIRKIGNVASNAAGALVACRLLPVRAVRLAAHGVAAVANANASADPVQQDYAEQHGPAGLPPAEKAATSSEDTPSPQERVFNHMDDVTLFKQQVARDFQTAQADVTEAFGFVLGKPSGSTSSEAIGSTTKPSQTVKEMVPIVASTVAGCAVAVSLAPVRAMRLAVASVAAQAYNATADSVQSEIRAPVLQADTEEALCSANDADAENAQIAADELLARRLQAE